jgi:carboxymethylenebutenolidase
MGRDLIHPSDRHGAGAMDRRAFLKRSSRLAAGTAAAGALLPLLERDRAMAEVIARDDPRLETSEIRYPGATGEVRAYWARPKGSQKLPAVLVIHENGGLVPHIQDVARRVALEGFLAMAPDALWPLGGTPADESQGPAMIAKLEPQPTIQNFVAAVRYLKAHPASTGKVGVVGFCWGGGMANQVAVNASDLVAAVPYYGRQPADEDVPKIKASLLLQYAGIDEGINRGIPAYEAALKRAGIDYRIHVYEGAQHAFNNDANPARYNEAAARLAWQRSIAFLKEKLKG